MSTIRHNFLKVVIPLVILVVLFLSQKNVFAINLPDWKPVQIDVNIPEINIPTIPPLPTLPIDFECPTCEEPSPTPEEPTPTITTPPPPPPGDGGNGGNGGTGGGGGGAGGVGGGEVLGVSSLAPTGTFDETVMYLSLILGLFFLAKALSTNPTKVRN